MVVSSPFGKLDGSPSSMFPQLYLSVPSIVAQMNSNDCGFGAAANSLALERHFKDRLFLQSEMKEDSLSPGCFSLDSSYMPVPLWDDMLKSSQGDQWQMSAYADILTTFQKEFVLLMDHLAVCRGKHWDEVAAVLRRSKYIPKKPRGVNASQQKVNDEDKKAGKESQ